MHTLWIKGVEPERAERIAARVAARAGNPARRETRTRDKHCRDPLHRITPVIAVVPEYNVKGTRPTGIVSVGYLSADAWSADALKADVEGKDLEFPLARGSNRE